MHALALVFGPDRSPRKTSPKRPAKPAIDATPIVEAPITDGRPRALGVSAGRAAAVAGGEGRGLAARRHRCVHSGQAGEGGLAPRPKPSRPTLLRRLSFDLTGLPPTPEELAAFESDKPPDAYERLVDRLLACPAYGERWAQHWLDLARFAETDGFEHDKVRPQAWKYRDWVIAALNADMPYDEFVRLQVAGEAEDRDQGPGDRNAI